MQRARGSLVVAVGLRGDATRLAVLRQEGCLRARLPRAVDFTEIVTLNTSGGIAGGDRLESAFDVRDGASATIAAQAAERFYRAMDGSPPSRVGVRITVGSGANAEWLPQESILFDGCSVARTLDVAVAPDARFLGVETLVFGRAAMGETVVRAQIADTIRVVRDGARLLHDAIRLSGPVAAMLARPAIANGGRAVSTLIHVAPDADTRLDAVRDALVPYDAGASAWNGMLLARIVSPDGQRARQAVTACLQVLREGRTLPRVWMC